MKVKLTIASYFLLFSAVFFSPSRVGEPFAFQRVFSDLLEVQFNADVVIQTGTFRDENTFHAKCFHRLLFIDHNHQILDFRPFAALE